MSSRESSQIISTSSIDSITHNDPEHQNDVKSPEVHSDVKAPEEGKITQTTVGAHATPRSNGYSYKKKNRAPATAGFLTAEDFLSQTEVSDFKAHSNDEVGAIPDESGPEDLAERGIEEIVNPDMIHQTIASGTFDIQNLSDIINVVIDKLQLIPKNHDSLINIDQTEEMTEQANQATKLLVQDGIINELAKNLETAKIQLKECTEKLEDALGKLNSNQETGTGNIQQVSNSAAYESVHQDDQEGSNPRQSVKQTSANADPRSSQQKLKFSKSSTHVETRRSKNLVRQASSRRNSSRPRSRKSSSKDVVNADDKSRTSQISRASTKISPEPSQENLPIPAEETTTSTTTEPPKEVTLDLCIDQGYVKEVTLDLCIDQEDVKEDDTNPATQDNHVIYKPESNQMIERSGEGGESESKNMLSRAADMISISKQYGPPTHLGVGLKIEGERALTKRNPYSYVHRTSYQLDALSYMVQHSSCRMPYVNKIKSEQTQELIKAVDTQAYIELMNDQLKKATTTLYECLDALAEERRNTERWMLRFDKLQKKKVVQEKNLRSKCRDTETPANINCNLTKKDREAIERIEKNLPISPDTEVRTKNHNHHNYITMTTERERALSFPDIDISIRCLPPVKLSRPKYQK